MTLLSPSPDVHERPAVDLHEIATAADCTLAARLLQEVWRSAQPPLPSNVIRAVQHTGGYAFGAYDESGTLLAVSIGLLAADRALHSHITGVAPAGQRRGLGYALKQHQRLWALDHGLTTITWTCDPLVRRNVMFNLHALGSEVHAYLPDHYGRMEDGVNAGEESDRFDLAWDLRSAAALEATQHRLPYLVATLPEAVAAASDGAPVVLHVEAPDRLVQLPTDIEALRRSAPAAAKLWRLAVRNAVLPALGQGAVIRGTTATGQLVLEVPA